MSRVHQKSCNVVIKHLHNNDVTPQPNLSKVLELQQSNQVYGESLRGLEALKNAKQKYFMEPFELLQQMKAVRNSLKS